MRPTTPLAAALGLLLCAAVNGATVFSDGFESYNLGQLDKNLAASANPAPNGSGNPWWGPGSSNGVVTGAINGVTPNSGNQMLTGTAPSDFDQDYVNIAYRFNNGMPFKGNVALNFSFYDVAGAGDTSSQGYGALAFYSTAPTTTDYPAGGNLTPGLVGATIQRLSLGMSSDEKGGYDSTVYQARVVGTAGGYDGTSGWFNTTTPRTTGWHHGRIDVGPALPGGGNDINFYIDDMTTPTLTETSARTDGFNLIELNSNFGTQSNYYDDISLTVVPEPGSMLALAAGALLLSGRRRRSE